MFVLKLIQPPCQIREFRVFIQQLESCTTARLDNSNDTVKRLTQEYEPETWYNNWHQSIHMGTHKHVVSEGY